MGADDNYLNDRDKIALPWQGLQPRQPLQMIAIL